MGFGNVKAPGSVAMALLCLFSFPAFAQSKPPESTSKVKRVML